MLRAVLLSDTDVVRFINDNFVPCWQMVRPVPRVTITFGNGRTLERTLGGNTIMEICLSDGRVVDAFPGVHTPQDLLGELRETLSLIREFSSDLTERGVTEAVLAWHRARLVAPPPARVPLSLEKALVESPLLRALRAAPAEPPPTDLLVAELGRLPTAYVEGEAPEAALERLSRQLEDVSKQPATVEQLRQRFLLLPEAQRPTPEQLGEMALRVDSRTSLNWVRPAVHSLFAGYDHLPRGMECRDTVFERILHIPVDDPYLGLATAFVPGTP